MVMCNSFWSSISNKVKKKYLSISENTLNFETFKVPVHYLRKSATLFEFNLICHVYRDFKGGDRIWTGYSSFYLQFCSRSSKWLTAQSVLYLAIHLVLWMCTSIHLMSLIFELNVIFLILNLLLFSLFFI